MGLRRELLNTCLSTQPLRAETSIRPTWSLGALCPPGSWRHPALHLPGGGGMEGPLMARTLAAPKQVCFPGCPTSLNSHGFSLGKTYGFCSEHFLLYCKILTSGTLQSLRGDLPQR